MKYYYEGNSDNNCSSELPITGIDNDITIIFPPKSILLAIDDSPQSLHMLIANSDKIDIPVILSRSEIKPLSISAFEDKSFIKSITFFNISKERYKIKREPIKITYSAKSFLYSFKIIVQTTVRNPTPIIFTKSITN